MEPKFIKGGPLPNSIGALADFYAEVRALRLAMSKATEEVHARETEVYNTILSWLSESPDTGGAGEQYRVQLVKKIRNQVADWPAVWAFIREHNAFELLQRRLSEPAIKELAEQGCLVIPGVTKAEVFELSFSKIQE